MHRNPLIGCKSNKSFLGHSDSSFKMLETAKNARNVMQRRTPPGYKSEVKAFPEDKINELLWEGFKMTNKKNDLSFLESYNKLGSHFYCLNDSLGLGCICAFAKRKKQYYFLVVLY